MDVVFQILGLIAPYMVISIMLMLFGWFLKRIPKTAWVLIKSRGNSNPIIANSYDDQHVEIQNEAIKSPGIIYGRSGWHILPTKVYGLEDENKAEDGKLSETERNVRNEAITAREICTKAFNISGLGRAFYLAFSRKAHLVNPEVQAAFEFGKTWNKKEAKFKIDRLKFIEVLTGLKDKDVVFEFFGTSFLDPRKIKEYIPEAYEKTTLDAIEAEARRQERQKDAKQNKMLFFVLIIAVVGIFGALIAMKLLGGM